MKNKKIWVYVIVLLAFVGINKLVYDYLNTNYKDNNQLIVDETESKVNPAPDFLVKDVNGYNVRLSNSYGKPIILNFWASWCSNCAEQLEEMQSLYDRYQDDVVFFMVNVTDGKKETTTKAKAYINENGYTFPIYFDINNEASIAYRASAIPMTFLIDQQGNLVSYGKGIISEDTISFNIDKLME
ncbi:MAG: TlpA disulfide reductase family protein [Erysipelotrichaceae bacterium]|nr:TlpA disulfide reductase family protein [Erysipelotrichaceae bacterium]